MSDEPKTYSILDIERSTKVPQYLKADVTGDSGRVLTEEMFRQALHDIPIWMEKRHQEKSAMRHEWWPIIVWLWESKRREDAARLTEIVAMAIDMGPPFVVNSTMFDFMQKCWKEYEERDNATSAV